MYTSTYVGQGDVPEAGMPITLVRVTQERMASGEEKYVGEYTELPKKLVFSKPIASAYKDAYGPLVRNWIGTRVLLRVDHSVMYMGKNTGGLRITPLTGAVPAAPPVKSAVANTAAQQPAKSPLVDVPVRNKRANKTLPPPPSAEQDFDDDLPSSFVK
jgi:hypothetical protein